MACTTGMMMRCFVIALLLAVHMLAAEVVYADENQHRSSAFLFAEKRNWKDASIHARRSKDPLLADIIRWMQIKDADSGLSSDSILGFVEAHPDWPDKHILLARARDAILNETPEAGRIKRWLKLRPKLPDQVKISARDKNIVGKFIRYAWVEGSYNKDQERRILKRFSRYISTKEYIARCDRLIWKRKYGTAERMLPLLSKNHRKLSAARLALARSHSGVNAAIRAVPKRLKKHSGLIYERLRWRHRKKLDSGVQELLLAAPNTVPYPEKWWRIRASHIRDAIEDGKYKLARRLLRNHGQTKGATYADALWLSGWLDLEFLDNPKRAYKYFYKLFNNVKYPVSKARGAYYAGRSAKANSNHDIAKSWYEIAAAYPTTYYGQLSAYALHKSAPLRLPAAYTPSSASMKRFAKKELARAVAMLMQAGQKKLAVKFLNQLVDTATSSAEGVIAARIGADIGSHYLGVKGAKRLMRTSLVDMPSAYPIPNSPRNTGIEHALMLAIARQESEFDRRAKSSAGAIGMMQLMPATAKSTARKMRLPYRKSRLYETQYNMKLGSRYLKQMIEQFDGSYILAIAAYNAGPGNARNWIRRFGRPGKKADDAIQWIEQIPFSETRNYVQRVLENLQAYRHIGAAQSKKTPHLQLHKDLTR